SGVYYRRYIGPRGPSATLEITAEYEPTKLPYFDNDITISSSGAINGGTELTSDLQRPLYSPISLFSGPDGITAVNLTQGDVTITSDNEDGTAEANGHRSGIFAVNANAGDVTITANDAEGRYFHGIFAATGPFYGYYYGGRVRPPYYDSPALSTEAEYDGPKIHEGSITITATGTVTGGQYAGRMEFEGYDGPPYVTSAALSTDAEPPMNLTNNQALQYGGAGVFVTHALNGDVDITVANEDGTASASGPLYGIAATNIYGGSVFVTVDNAAGDEGAGVAVYNDEDGGEVSVTTNGDVTGGTYGIWTVNEGEGDTTVSVGGVVEGEDDTGIKVIAKDGALATITLRDGADVSGGETAIYNNGSDSETTLEAGSKLSGDSEFGDGNDNLTIEGDADISDVTLLDGDGSEEPVTEGEPEVAALAAEEAGEQFFDILTFNGFTGTVEATTALENWEEGVFKGGDTTLDLAELNIPEVTLLEDAEVSLTNPDFTLNGDLAVQSGTFNAGVGGMGDVMVMGTVNNEGLISLANGNPGDKLTISGHFTGGGDLAFDVDFAGNTNDMIAVGGNTTGPMDVDINAIGTATEANEYTLITVDGASSDGDFALANPNSVNSDGDDAIANGAFLYTLDRRAAAGSFVLTPFDSTGATQFNPSVAVFETVPTIFTDLAGLDDFLSRFQGQGGASNPGGVSQALLDFSTTNDNTFYARITGQQSDRDLTNILRTNVDTTSTELSMGFDVPMYEGGSGTLFGGFNFAYLNSDSTITSFAGLGSVENEVFGYTFSAFYLTDAGFYVDGRYRFSFFDSNIIVASGLGALGLVTEGTANSASLEVGKLIGLSNGLTLIPQLQVQHVDVSSNPLVDPLTGTAVGVITDGETTTGRVGLWVERASARNTIFGSVNIFHDFDGTTTTNFAGIPFSSKREDTRLELGVGGEVAVGANSTVFGRVFAAGGLGDWTADETYTATAGFRLNF
ncbi:MAG: autotransporter outer membrane beta-barrel domain-containing protein, partial [Pseudomonadota bacterium]